MTIPTVKMFGGFNMPIVGLGTWGDASLEATVENEKELETALDAALENGYRHIDTAYFYKNEHIIARVLKKWFSSGKLKREEVFVTTKLPMEAVNPDRVETYIKKSLENLQLDYIDLYLIHFPVCFKLDLSSKDSYITEPTDHVAVWKKMEEQVDTGRTKTIGLSNFNINQIERILKIARIKPTCLQVELHVFLPQYELVKYAQNNGIVVVAYSPLANPSINKYMVRLGFPSRELPTMHTNLTIKSVAEKHKKSPAQIMLKYLVQRNIVIIPKSVSVKRIKENIDLFDFSLDEKDLAALKREEVGESARVCNFPFTSSLPQHPEWPFPKQA